MHEVWRVSVQFAKLRGLDTPSEGSEGFFLVYIMSNANPYGEFLNSGGLPCKTLTMKKLAHHPHLIFNLFQYGAGFCALREPPITFFNGYVFKGLGKN